MSAYVLSQLFPGGDATFASLLRALRTRGEQRFALAALNDFLAAIAAADFSASVAHADLHGLDPLQMNYVAAMVELAAHQKGIASPDWTRAVVPLDQPYFASPLHSHRLHLLTASPVPFKRRNLFVDSVVGDRV